MTNLERAEFVATLPDIQSALKFGSDGARVQLQIPEVYLGEAAKLIGMKNKELKVVLEVVENSKKSVNY